MGLFEGFDFLRVGRLLVEGMGTTILVTVCSLAIALVIGLLSCLAKALAMIALFPAERDKRIYLY